MKKKLEAELISIAHRILKLKNKSELVQLHQETQKLYEKLSVLVFVEDHFGDAKPTIGKSEANEILENVFESESEIKNEVVATEPEMIVEDNNSDKEVVSQITEEVTIEEEKSVANLEEEAKTEVEETNIEAEEENEVEETAPTIEVEKDFIPSFELEFDSKPETIEDVKEEIQPVLIEDLLGVNYSEPVFVKPEELFQIKEVENEVDQEQPEKSENNPQTISINKNNSSKLISLNDRLSKGITIGLNDRIAFINNLFGTSSEDYNRVLSQIMTFDTFEEVQQFIDDMVKPDYNNWEGKEEYAERFLAIIEKKFN